MNSGQFYIISAPSGAGKTSLLKALCQVMHSLHVSVSHTTRPPRSDEKDGENYHFVSIEIFEQMIKNNELLEYAEVFNNFYGTSRRAVEKQTEKGINVVLEVDWQGARQIRQYAADAVSIFILPPSKKELCHRLENRGTDSREIVAKRMAAAASEISHYDEFDHIIVNDQFDRALMELQAIIQNGSTPHPDTSRYKMLVRELLS